MNSQLDKSTQDKMINTEILKTLRKIIRYQTRTEEDTEDILQEVMLKILKNKDNINPTKFLSWLYTISKTTSIDFYRKKKDNVEYDDEILSKLEISANDKNQAMEELSKCVVPIFNQLNKEDSNILSMVEISGVSQKEAALKIGIPYSTFKSKLQKARLKFKDVMLNCCELEMDNYNIPIDIKKKNDNCAC